MSCYRNILSSVPHKTIRPRLYYTASKVLYFNVLSLKIILMSFVNAIVFHYLYV